MSVESWDWSLRVFDHVDVHASDYAESVRFYETVLAPLGIPKLVARDDWTCFANLNVVNRQPATQNLHLCFYAREKAHVDAFHEAGIEAGYRSNGRPGYRKNYGPGYFASYLLDPDGTTSRRSTATRAISATAQARRFAESLGTDEIVVRQAHNRTEASMSSLAATLATLGM